MFGVNELIAEARALGLPEAAVARIVFSPNPPSALEAVALCRYAQREDLIGLPLEAARARILNDRAAADEALYIDTARRMNDSNPWQQARGPA